MKNVPETLAGDLLRGVAEISAYVDLPAKRTYYALERGHLPAFKVGGLWCARRSELSNFLSAAGRPEAA